MTLAGFEAGTPVADGDIFVVTVEDVKGVKYLLASFHGDTNGLATIPVVKAVNSMHARLGTEFKCAHGSYISTQRLHSLAFFLSLCVWSTICHIDKAGLAPVELTKRGKGDSNSGF